MRQANGVCRILLSCFCPENWPPYVAQEPSMRNCAVRVPKLPPFGKETMDRLAVLLGALAAACSIVQFVVWLVPLL